MKLPLTIDSINYSAATSQNGYSCTLIKREGKNSGIMLDGSRTVDILDFKISVSYVINPAEGVDIARLYASCMKDYVTATVWDATTNDEKTATFIPAITGTNAEIIRSGEKWFNGISLTLEEK